MSTLRNPQLSKLPDIVWVSFFFLVFVVVKFQDLSLNLWNDEIYSMKHFVFVPWRTVFTDYHVPNNHIFFNAVNKIYLSIWGITDLRSALSHPTVVRSIGLFYVFLALYYLFAFCKVFYNKSIAILTLSFLLGTIPFLNFSLEARGYMLSIVLLSIILFAYSKITRRKEYYHLLSIIICTALLAYTTPSNYLFIGGLLTFILFTALFNWEIKIKYILTIVSILAGIGLSLLLYAPVFDSVFNNEYVASHPDGYQKAYIIVKDTWPHFLSWRYYTIPFLFIPFFFINSKVFLKKIIPLILLFITPFIINFLLKNNAPHRVFVPSCIAFALMCSVAVEPITKWQPLKNNAPLIIILLIVLNITFSIAQLAKNRNTLYTQLLKSNRCQDLYLNYYMAYFHPNKAVDLLQQNRKDNTPVIIYREEPHDLPHYLEERKISFTSEENFDEMLNSAPMNAYVFARHINKFEERMQNKYTHYKWRRLNKEVDYFNLYLIEKKMN